MLLWSKNLGEHSWKNNYNLCKCTIAKKRLSHNCQSCLITYPQGAADTRNPWSWAREQLWLYLFQLRWQVFVMKNEISWWLLQWCLIVASSVSTTAQLLKKNLTPFDDRFEFYIEFIKGNNVFISVNFILTWVAIHKKLADPHISI